MPEDVSYIDVDLVPKWIHKRRVQRRFYWRMRHVGLTEVCTKCDGKGYLPRGDTGAIVCWNCNATGVHITYTEAALTKLRAMKQTGVLEKKLKKALDR